MIRKKDLLKRIQELENKRPTMTVVDIYSPYYGTIKKTYFIDEVIAAICNKMGVIIKYNYGTPPGIGLVDKEQKKDPA